MNYHKLYYNIINSTVDEIGYTELHHIIPKCVGGTDNISNIAKLTARKHFLCHYLLTKMYPANSAEWHKMNSAFRMMGTVSGNQQRYTNSRLYEGYRKAFSVTQSFNQTGCKNSNFGSQWIHNVSTQQNSKITSGTIVPNGWSLGRKFIWDAHKNACIICGKNYTPIYDKRSMYCSSICRATARELRKNTSSRQLAYIAKKYKIVPGSVLNNCEFILCCVKLKVSIIRILDFLSCARSGANYQTIKKLSAGIPLDYESGER